MDTSWATSYNETNLKSFNLIKFKQCAISLSVEWLVANQQRGVQFPYGAFILNSAP